MHNLNRGHINSILRGEVWNIDEKTKSHLQRISFLCGWFTCFRCKSFIKRKYCSLKLVNGENHRVGKFKGFEN